MSGNKDGREKDDAAAEARLAALLGQTYEDKAGGEAGVVPPADLREDLEEMSMSYAAEMDDLISTGKYRGDALSPAWPRFAAAAAAVFLVTAFAFLLHMTGGRGDVSPAPLPGGGGGGNGTPLPVAAPGGVTSPAGDGKKKPDKTDNADEQDKLKKEIAALKKERANLRKKLSEVTAAIDRRNNEPRRKLRQKVTFDLQKQRLEDVLSLFSTLLSVNIVTDPKVKEKLESPITLKVRDMAGETALKWALKMTGLVYSLRDGAVFVHFPESADAGEKKTAETADGPNEVLDILRDAKGATFIRHTKNKVKEYDGEEMALRVAGKHLLAGLPRVSAAEFVDRYCTRSALHGTRYMVRLKGEKAARPLGEWLRKQLRLRKAARVEEEHLRKKSRRQEGANEKSSAAPAAPPPPPPAAPAPAATPHRTITIDKLKHKVTVTDDDE